MTQQSSKRTHIATVLLLALLTLCLMVPALAAEEITCTYSLDLPVTAMDEPSVANSLILGATHQSYFVTWEGSLVAVVENPAELSAIIREAAERYVGESTLSCIVAEHPSLKLCYGKVNELSPTDLEPVRQLVMEQLQFVTVEQTREEESVPYDLETVYDPEVYLDLDPVIKVPGEEGVVEIVTETTCLNGRAQSSEIESNVLREPVTEVVSLGSKERPEYLWPTTQGYISSRFGYRNVKIGSRFHKGIDIAVRTGTDICAAKAGTVTYSGWMNGYGNLVEIDHGDGTSTRYGHNSKLLVSKGQTVEQGEVIALSGNTGRSSGPHCHFEIRIDGTPTDPMPLLPSR